MKSGHPHGQHRPRSEETGRFTGDAHALDPDRWVRVTCPACGVVRVQLDDVVLRNCVDDRSWSYRARCSRCRTLFLAETPTTLVIRGAGGFGGQPGQRPVAPEFPDREPDARIALSTREDQALIYRLSGDRNPLHSDPWFARELAGFPKPILHGLCTYGVSGRALVAELGKGVAANVTSIESRFTSPVFPGETLTTLIWRTEPGKAVFRTEASGANGSDSRVVLDDGAVEYVG